MAVHKLEKRSNAVTIINAAAANTSLPTASSDRLRTGRSSGIVRVHVDYTGSLTAANLVQRIYDVGARNYHIGSTTALAPASGDQSFTQDIGKDIEFTYQLTGMTGTGTATVRVEQA